MTFPSYKAFLLTCILVLPSLIGCNANKSVKSERGNGQGSQDPSDNPEQSSGTTNGDSPNPGDDASDFQAGQDPALVTGINLVGVDNGRVRCDYTQEASNNFLLHCALVAVQANGSEAKADGFKDGVSATWQMPSIKAGNAVTKSCSPSADKLTQSCDVTTTDGFAKLQFDVGLSDVKVNRQKTVSTEVLLPYSVGVAAGIVPRLPFVYQEQKQVGMALASSGVPEKLGFQRYWFPPEELRTNIVTDVCSYKGSTFFVDSHQVFEHKDGMLSLYGGNTNLMINFATAKDRYQVPLGMADNLLACGPEGIYFLEIDFAIGIMRFDGSVKYLAAYRVEDGAIGDQTILTKLHTAQSMTVDQDGNYFVTTANHVIYRVNGTTGAVSIVAGTLGTPGLTGDGGPASQARLNGPKGITISPGGEIVFADSNNGRIRKIGKDGVITSLYGSNLTPGSFIPESVTYSPSGDLYLYDFNDSAISKIDTQGVLTHVAGNGQFAAPPDGPIPAATSAISEVTSLSVDDAGNIFIVLDKLGVASIAKDGSLRRLTKYLNFVASPDGKALGNKIGGVKSVTIGDDGVIYFVDYNAGSLHKVTQDGTMSRLFANRIDSGLPQVGGQVNINVPEGLAIDAANNMYFIENSPNPRVTRITPAGVATVLADQNSGLDLNTLVSISYGKLTFGNRTGVFVSDVFNGRIWFFDAQNNFAPQLLLGQNLVPWTPIINNINVYPAGLSLSKGDLYFVDDTTGDMVRLDSTGAIQPTVSSIFYPMTSALVPTGYTPNIFAVTNAGTSYQIFNDSALLALPPNIPVDWSTLQTIPKPIFGNVDVTTATPGVCGFGRVDNKVAAQNINGAIQASMAVMCSGRPTAIFIKDTCPAVGGSTTIVFAQTFAWDQDSNIVQIVKPCTD